MFGTLCSALLPIVVALVLGWFAGKKLPFSLRQRCIQSIGYLVWLLLIAIGCQFGEVLFNPTIGRQIIIDSIVYSTLISIITFAGFFSVKSRQSQQKIHLKALWHPIKACALAMSMVGIGLILYLLAPHWNNEHLANWLLLILIVCIGVDLSNIRLQKLEKIHFIVPGFAIIAMCIAAYLATFILQHSFLELLTIGSGFGWFSLSGSLVGKLLGSEAGTFALLTDLFREFYGILLLYLFGTSMPLRVIAVCGATAMDSTLPLVKENCSQQDVQIAIFSGFILTLIAPFLIIFLSAFI
ncbi:MAG: lysine exporter LysO family protein [Acinetobacter sp.]